MTERRSPLDAAHRDLGAKFATFGGWEMPLEYAGTISEHLACRTSVAMFDVSHLGTVRLDGPDAHDRLQRAFTNDLAKIAPGRAQYTHLLDQDGSVLDDIIVWWHPDGVTFDVMPNASNTARVVAAVGGRDTTAERAVVAVQGPDARDRVAAVVPGAELVRRFRVGSVEWRDTVVTVAGTGYTGEDGLEVAIEASHARDLWDELLAVEVTPAGLGARDTLRLEAALPLHGHELGPGITPLQAGLGWVVAFDKPEFPGRAALIAERDRGVARHLVGLATEGRRPPRAGYEVRVGSTAVGHVTSGNFSPTLGHGIALALVGSEIGPPAAVEIVARGSTIGATVVETPFVTR